MRILIIEDDAGIAELFRAELEDLNYQVDWVDSFDAADRFLLEEEIHLMIVDYSLSSEENAQDWLVRRKASGLSIPPFIMSTGQGDERIAVEMMKLGARDYLVKDTMLITRLPDIMIRVATEIDNEAKLKQADETIAKQLQLTQILMNISTSFINLPLSEVESAIQNSLRDISVFVKADQSYIFHYDFEQQVAHLDFEWCDIGFSPRCDLVKSVPMDQMDNWIPLHQKGEVVFVEYIAHYDQEHVRETAKAYGIKSVIAIPMMDQDKCIGFVSFDSIKENRFYSDREQNLFKVFTQLLVSIHNRRESVQELRKNEIKYRLLFEKNPQPMWFFELDTLNFLEVNDAAVEHYGYSRKEFLSMTIKAIRPKEDLELMVENLAIMMQKNRSLIFARHVKKNGEIVDVELTTVHVIWNGKKAIHIMVKDITEQKQAQEKLQDKRDILNKVLLKTSQFIESGIDEINYSELTDIMLEITGAKFVAFNLYDQDGTSYMTKCLSGISNFAASSMNILGFNLYEKKWKNDPFKNTKSERIAIKIYENLREIADNALPKSVVQVLENAFSLGQVVVVSTSINNRQFLGDFVLLFDKVTKLKNSEIAELFSNQVGQYIVRNNTEKAMRESEEKYRYLFENNPQPMWIYDVDTLAFIEVNNAAVTHYGYTRSEFLSMTLFDLSPPDDIPELVKSIAKAREIEDHSVHRRHLKKNDEIIYVEIISKRIQFGNHNARHVLVNDITKRKIIEDELHRKLTDLLEN